MRFVSNEPLGQDLFEGQSQERIATIIAKNLLNSCHKIIGLDGGWGSGKSNVVKIVENKLAEQNVECSFFIYDVWGHQQDLQRRTILQELLDFLLGNSFIDNTSKLRDNLNSLTGKVIERKKTSIPRVSVGIFISFLFVVLTPFFGFLATDVLGKVHTGWKVLLYLLPVLLLFLVYLKFFFDAFQKWEWQNALSGALAKLLAIYKDKEIEQSCAEFTNEYNPSVLQFLGFFSDIGTEITPSKHIVLVFDNMDRVSKERVKELWASLHILFADRRKIPANIHVIIPFDRSHIQIAFCAEGGLSYGDDYINKTFDIVYRVAPPVLSDWKRFFKLKWIEAEIKVNDEEYSRIEQIYDLLSREQTPRSIIVFINEFVSIIEQTEEKIPGRYIAIFILKKNEILYGNEYSCKNNFDNDNSDNRSFYTGLNKIQQTILDKNYLGALEFLYQDDLDLSKYIASLVYQIPSSRSIQVVYSKQIQVALENGDGKTLKDIQDKEVHFNELLDDVMVDLVNPENVAIALGALNQERLGVKRQAKWDELHSLCRGKSLTIDKDALSDSHRLLVENVTKKDEMAIQILSNIVDKDSDFNAVAYYKVLCDICKILEQSNINIEKRIPMKKVEANQFVEMLAFAKEACEWTRLETDVSKLDAFLLTKNVDELKKIESISYAPESLRHNLSQFRSNLENLFNSYRSDRDRLPIIVKLLRETTQGLLQITLDDNQIATQFKGLNVGDLGYYDLLAMRLARGSEFNEQYDSVFADALQEKLSEEHIKKQALISMKYENFDSFLVHSKRMRGSNTYIAIAKYYIKNAKKLDLRADIAVLIPDITEISSAVDVGEETMWEVLSMWENPDIEKKDVPTVLTLSTLKSAIKSKSKLAKFSVNRAREYFESLTEEEWRKILKIHTQYGVSEFMVIDGRWTTNQYEYIKQVLCEMVRDVKQIPANSKWVEIIEYTQKQNLSVSNIVNSVIDTMLEVGIKVSQFVFFGDWIFEYGILDQDQRVCRKIFQSQLLDDSDAVKIILKYKEKMPAILQKAGDDADMFKKALQEKIDINNESELMPLAKILGIKPSEPTDAKEE